jgi:DNA-binding transcriptional ArsR family regulator
VESSFAILAEPNRRAILSVLAASERSVGELEQRLRMSQPSVSKHLRVLREAGFVEARVDAQRRLYRIRPEPLMEVDAWLAPFRRFWSTHVDALERHLDRMSQTAKRQALTDPAHLREWAPFDANRNLGETGPVKLTTFGAPAPHVTESTVRRAEPPRVLEYGWGENDLRWELEPLGSGTRLTLWTQIDRRFVSMGAAGWHVCLDVLDQLIAGDPIGRIAGMEAMQHAGWQRLNGEYAAQFGVELPSWGAKA